MSTGGPRSSVQSLALSRTTTLDGLATFVNRWRHSVKPPVVRSRAAKSCVGCFRSIRGTQRTDTLMPVVMRVRILDAKGMALRDQSLPFQESSFANRRTECVITLDAHAGRVSP